MAGWSIAIPTASVWSCGLVPVPIIRDLTEYNFTDEAWMKKRTRCYDKPLNIYELHLGSWKMKDGKWYTYNEIADELIAYLK